MIIKLDTVKFEDFIFIFIEYITCNIYNLFFILIIWNIISYFTI